MADNPVNTYKRYKAGTEKLVQWLMRSADRCDITLPHTTSKVSASELLLIAKRITRSTKPKIDIPIEILDVAKDAVHGRRDCAEWYAGLADDQSETSVIAQSKPRHQHFLRKLNDIFEILQAAHKIERQARAQPQDMPALASEINDLTNLYAHLELEEPNEVRRPENTATASSKGKTKLAAKPERRGSRYELVDEDEEACFSIWCLFKDFFDDVRPQHVGSLCARRAQLPRDLQDDEMTDVGLDIVMHTADEFSERYPHLKNFDLIVQFIGADDFIVNARHTQLRFGSSHSKTDEVEIPVEQDMSDLLCMPAWCAMSDFRDLATFLWVRDTREDLQEKKFRVKFPSHSFEKALLSNLVDFKKWCPDPANWPAEGSSRDNEYTHVLGSLDVYTQELVKLTVDCHPVGDREISTGLLAATQMYMDIYETLEGNLARGFLETLVAYGRITDIGQRFRAFCDQASDYAGKHLKSASTAKRTISDFENVVQFGKEKDGQKGWTFQLGEENPQVFLPLKVITTMPLLAGHHLSTPLNTMHMAGVGYMNARQIVLAAAHLYKAATVYGVSGGAVWDDMEFVVKRLNERGKFLRNCGDSVSSVARACRLALGVPINEVMKDDVLRSPGLRRVHRDSVDALFPSHFVQAFVGAKTPKLMKLGADRNSDSMEVYYNWLRLHATESGGIKDPVIASQWTNTKRLSPVQLLSVLLESFIQDEPYFTFDYVNFTAGCLQLLDQVAGIVLGVGFGPDWRNNEAHCPMYEAVDMILSNSLIHERRGTPKHFSALFGAGKMLEDFIRRSGDTVLKRTVGSCSGRIPDERKPAVRYPPSKFSKFQEPKLDWLVFGDRLVDELQEEGKHRSEEELTVCRKGAAELQRRLAAGAGEREAAEEMKQWIDRRFQNIKVFKHIDIDILDGKVSVTTRAHTEDEMSDLCDAMTEEQRMAAYRTGITLE